MNCAIPTLASPVTYSSFHGKRQTADIFDSNAFQILVAPSPEWAQWWNSCEPVEDDAVVEKEDGVSVAQHTTTTDRHHDQVIPRAELILANKLPDCTCGSSVGAGGWFCGDRALEDAKDKRRFLIGGNCTPVALYHCTEYKGESSWFLIDGILNIRMRGANTCAYSLRGH